MARPPPNPPGGSPRPGPVGAGDAGPEGERLAVDAEHLAGPGGGQDLPGSGQADGHAGLVGGVEAEADPGAAVAVDPDPAGAAVAAQHPDQRQVGRALHQRPVGGGRLPGQGDRGRPPGARARSRRSGRTGRGAGSFRPTSGPGGSPPTSGPARRTRPWRRCRVQAQVVADLAAEAGAEQQGRGLDGPGGGHHRPRPDHQPVPAVGPGLYPDGLSVVDQHPAGVGPDDQPGPGRGGLLQVGDQGRLLGFEPAAEPAPAAAGVLGAAADVAGQRAGVPAEPLQAPLQELVPDAGAALGLGDPEPAGDRRQRGRDLFGGEGVHARHLGPLLQHRRRGRERGRVVHHRAPAKGRPGHDRQPRSSVVRVWAYRYSSR